MKRIFFALTVSLLTVTAFAQTNFSGAWILKDKEYIDGPQYQNAFVEQFAINQDKDSVIIESAAKGQDGSDIKTRAAIALNGKICPATSVTTGRKMERSAKWSDDKKNLIITTAIYQEGSSSEIELTRVDTYSLSNNQLTIHRKSIETISDDWEARGIYEKQ